MSRLIKYNRPCAIYVRVSTQMQADVGLSLESQIDTLRREAEKREKPVYKVYSDTISGGTFNRPAFQDMMRDTQIKPPPFDLVLTWSVSRFGRNTMESYIATEKLKERGVSIFYHKEPFDSDDTLGKLIIEILRAVSEFSRLEYVKDVERSKKHLARKGYSTGGPPPFGLRRVEVQDNGCKRIKWEPDPETAPVAKNIFEMYADGMGFKKITAFLNEKGITTIRGLPWRSSSFSRMLRNEIYIGNVVYNKEEKRNGRYCGSLETKDPEEWVRYDGAVDPIVPRRIFDRVQKRLAKSNKSKAHSLRSQYLLGGLIKCNVCGKHFHGFTSKKIYSGKEFVYTVYVCSSRGSYVKKRDNRNLNRADFDKLVVNKLFDKILSKANLQKTREKRADEIKAMAVVKKREIAALQRDKEKVEMTLQKYYKAFEDGKLDPEKLAVQIEKYQGSIKELEFRISDMKASILACQIEGNQFDDSILDIDFDKIRNMFDGLSFSKRKELVNTFIHKIVIDPEWYEIHYNIPTGFDPDKFLTSGPDDSGNGGAGGQDDGVINSRRTFGKPKNRDNRADVSDQNFVGEKHGEGGIRTLVDVNAEPVFETGTFSLSVTSPSRKKYRCKSHICQFIDLALYCLCLASFRVGPFRSESTQIRH